MKKSSILSNCYVPLTISPEKTTPKEWKDHLVQHRTNGDGESRTKEQLRRLCLETTILSSHAGSSLVELGHTKVLAKVSIGTDGNHSQVDTGVLQIRVDQVANFGMPPASTVSALDGNVKRSNSQTHQVDMEARIHAALLPALNLTEFPKIVLQVDITVLQNDGSLLSAGMAATTLALLDAGVELHDLVTCCQVVVIGKDLLADPTLEEEQAADATVTLALMPNWKEVTLWQQSGPAPAAAMDLCRDGCRTLLRFVRQHLIDKEGML